MALRSHEELLTLGKLGQTAHLTMDHLPDCDQHLDALHAYFRVIFFERVSRSLPDLGPSSTLGEVAEVLQTSRDVGASRAMHKISTL